MRQLADKFPINAVTFLAQKRIGLVAAVMPWVWTFDEAEPLNAGSN